MRLLYVCSDFGIPPNGTKGPSIHLRSITRAICETGHEVFLLSPNEGPDDDHPARRLLPAGCKPADRDAKMLRRWMNARGLDDTLAREFRPLFYNAWVPERALAALKEQPVDAIFERLSLFSHVGIDLADACGKPLIVEVNAVLTEEAARYRALQHVELAREIEQRVFHRADALLTVSAQLADRLVDRGVKPDRIHVIPNGVDLKRFTNLPPRESCRAALGLTGAFVVGFVGSLKVWHGADVLVDAFARIAEVDPTARLLIVGTGPMEEQLRVQTRGLGIEQCVTLTGAVPHDRVPHHLAAMDVATAPYKPIHGFYFSPIKLFEYMAAGACAVASRAGQIEEIIEDGVNGLLCNPGDSQDLYRCLSRLHATPAWRQELTVAAHRTVRERFTWQHAAQKTLDVVGRVLDGARATNTATSESEVSGATETVS